LVPKNIETLMWFFTEIPQEMERAVLKIKLTNHESLLQSDNTIPTDLGCRYAQMNMKRTVDVFDYS
jgi:hypothetical protein